MTPAAPPKGPRPTDAGGRAMLRFENSPGLHEAQLAHDDRAAEEGYNRAVQDAKNEFIRTHGPVNLSEFQLVEEGGRIVKKRIVPLPEVK